MCGIQSVNVSKSWCDLWNISKYIPDKRKQTASGFVNFRPLQKTACKWRTAERDTAIHSGANKKKSWKPLLQSHKSRS